MPGKQNYVSVVGQPEVCIISEGRGADQREEILSES